MNKSAMLLATWLAASGAAAAPPSGRTLVPGGRPLPAWADPARELLELLNSPDPAVRAQAAKALKAYALEDRVERRLLEALGQSHEEEAVRREAAKSLSVAVRNDRTKRRLLELGRNPGEPAGLRGVAFKALWLIAGWDGEVLSDLHDALRGSQEAEVQAAAAWTLFAAEQDYGTRKLLVETARSPGIGLEVRIEAVKSLMIPMIQFEVRRPVMALAADPAAEEALREAAMLSLMGANNDYEVRSFLEEAARREPSPSLRRAATQALGGLTIEWARFFHLGYFRRHGRVIYLDPLE